jgi:hypothetical protein
MEGLEVVGDLMVGICVTAFVGVVVVVVVVEEEAKGVVEEAEVWRMGVGVMGVEIGRGGGAERVEEAMTGVGVIVEVTWVMGWVGEPLLLLLRLWLLEFTVSIEVKGEIEEEGVVELARSGLE